MSKDIVVFAGNECHPDRKKYYYNLSYQTGKILAENGYTVITGGGPGLMDQVSRGAYEAAGMTIGVRLIRKGREQSSYLKKKYDYKLLRLRQKKLLSLGGAFIAMPGGIGTMYEIFELLALKRKNEIPRHTPLILIDDYFHYFNNFMKYMEIEGFIRSEDISLYRFIDTYQQVCRYLKSDYE